MSYVIEFVKPDFLSYITNEDGKPIGVKAKGFSATQERKFAHIDLWKTELGTILRVDEFNQICIAWLALHDPDVLKFDDE
tara:strand:+ start:1302 stop:1541 length:240 start_codon:yes stop_codon:yes gene_type:complete